MSHLPKHTPADGAGASSGSYKTYAAGFILSILLTLIAFTLVMSGGLPRTAVWVGIFSAAILQILVQLHYFLHLDTSSASRWNIMALLLTVLIMAILVGGSIWIMHSLNDRMM